MIKDKVDDIISKLTTGMADFIKLDTGRNFQAAKRSRQLILEIEKNDIKELKELIKQARVAREYIQK